MIMTSETIKLNLIPGGELPVLHASQFDDGRALSFEIYDGDEPYTAYSAYDISLHLRKVDGTIIGIDTFTIDTENDCVVFTTTEQMCACAGKNIGELVFTDTLSGVVVGSCNFILEVEPDPYAGGIDSASEIENLSTQIAAIVDSQLDNYYTKEEIDDQIETIVTEQVTPIVSGIVSEQVPPIVESELTNYYTKSETDSAFYNKSAVDTLLSGKADTSDLPDMNNYYDKTTTDTLLASKANTSTTYTKTEVDNLIAAIPATDITTEITTPASVQTFTDGGNNIPLKSLVTEIVPVQAGSGDPSPSNPRAISGHSDCVVTVSDGDSTSRTTTISLGTTVYGGSLECVNGALTISKIYWEFDGSNDEAWQKVSGTGKFYINIPDIVKTYNAGKISNIYPFSGSTNSSAGVTVDKSFYTQRNEETPEYNRFWIYNSDYDSYTVEQFRQVLDNQPLQIVADFLTTEYIYTIVTGANIPTLPGNNEISTDCGDIRSVEYFNDKADDIAAMISLMTRS